MTKEIVLSNGDVTIVDDEDFEYLNQFKWYLGNYGYARRNAKVNDGKRKTLFIHRIVTNALDGEVIDHINRNRLDNRKENLRKVTMQQNRINSDNQTGNTSHFRGVSYNKRTGKRKAQIKCNYKTHTLGYFSTEEEAALKYNESAVKYFGEYAVLNELEGNEKWQK
ncbi:hypothetical protein [Microcystis phage MaeS]|nr:hypothetical protein [Microcystis phage MaeS]